jgi:hypothetical protein
MDAAFDALEQEKLQLLNRLGEIEVQQQRQRGMFDKVPHFSEIEDAGHKLGQFLSRLSQARMANEVAAEMEVLGECPSCGEACRVETVQRTVAGIDGPVEMLEPKAHCSACRRGFFPSA